MSDKTDIAWTDATWNPVIGCQRVSAGCEHCYAERLVATRLAHTDKYSGLAKMTPDGPRWTGEVRIDPTATQTPLRWREPRRVFVCSMGDLFHEWMNVDDIAEVWRVMACATLGCRPHPGRSHDEECWTGEPHTFQVLTKRPRRMRALLAKLPEYVSENWPGDDPLCVAMDVGQWPLPNVWLGVTAENQAIADERIPILLDTPAAVRFVSCEPLLGPVDLTRYGKRYCVRALSTCGEPALHWVICGGETGPGARPMDPDWARSLRDQCRAAGVPFFMKQMSGRQPIPADLQIRQWPDVTP